MTTSVTTRTAGALKTHAKVLGGSVAAFWATFALNSVMHGALNVYGVIPRTTLGLRGIVFSPFLHGNYAHLVANTVPFLILGWLVMLTDGRKFFPVTICAMLGAGLMAWTLGAPNSVHIGASGVIFGYLGYLMLTGWFTRSIWSILVSVGVTVMWGGLVWGVLPNQPGVSWQAHLGGFLGGVLAAKLFRRPAQ